ncbi:glycosyltransferase family 2 protein [Polynucleobacter sp. MWH-CaK5]|uniref:glycosyltransferase family 2 protein n=1 Tax=Polynucleobacter sp. MWH-CaK5 TaxID=2689107 RepID=UPI001BFDC590|nr:glycosyltransferase family A protein [Polynucleobacter sp. MWH-CaK5]QWD89169.1 glycosyltransferase family 2 protein [Polynucleobacter sp. MWH-CaK5]
MTSCNSNFDQKRISVSVVIPCYRSSQTLWRAISSIKRQSVLPLEVLLVDDCSDDNDATYQLFQEIKLDAERHRLFDVVLLSLSVNSGPGCARNLGWDAARADYIAFLDADDSWHPLKLKIQYEFMISNKNIDLCAHGSVSKVGGESTLGIYDGHYPTKSVKLFPMLFKNNIATRTVMLKNNCKEKFHNLMRYAEDYDLWLRIIGSGGRVVYLDINLAYVYRSEWSSGGLSGNLWAMQVGESKALFNLYRCKKISFPVLLIAEVFSWIKFLRRVFIKRVIGNE